MVALTPRQALLAQTTAALAEIHRLAARWDLDWESIDRHLCESTGCEPRTADQ